MIDDSTGCTQETIVCGCLTLRSVVRGIQMDVVTIRRVEWIGSDGKGDGI